MWWGSSSPPATNPPPGGTPSNGASFSVIGTWAGTATSDNFTDDDTSDDINRAVTLVISKDAASVTGKGVAGTRTIAGVGNFPFTDSFVAPTAGASRFATIEASDAQGYLYELTITFTDKRADGGQLVSSNPALETNRLVFLETSLVKQ